MWLKLLVEGTFQGRSPDVMFSSFPVFCFIILLRSLKLARGHNDMIGETYKVWLIFLYFRLGRLEVLWMMPSLLLYLMEPPRPGIWLGFLWPLRALSRLRRSLWRTLPDCGKQVSWGLQYTLVRLTTIACLLLRPQPRVHILALLGPAVTIRTAETTSWPGLPPAPSGWPERERRGSFSTMSGRLLLPHPTDCVVLLLTGCWSWEAALFPQLTECVVLRFSQGVVITLLLTLPPDSFGSFFSPLSRS